MEVERQFELTIPDETVATIATVGGLFDYVATNSPLAMGETRAGAYYGPFWERYCDIVSNEIGVEREKLLPTARFVQDLGVD
jgi:acyl carrier protein